MEDYLHEHIPLSKAMGTEVVSIDADAVVLTAPLEPNLNHRGTAFGGSVVTLAILAGWTLVHFKLRSEGFETQTVIHESDMRYDRPIEEAMTARCGDLDPDAWARFTRTLRRRGKARIRVAATLECGGEIAGHFSGAYVAIAV